MPVAWIAREEVVLPAAVPEPDVRAPDLVGAAEQIAR